MALDLFSDGEREQRRREAKRMSSISELERMVVEAAKACKSEPPPGAWRVLSDAVAALRAAEEAARKPRLRRYGEFIDQERRGSNYQQPLFPTEVLVARDAEWMAAIRKLPRWGINVYAPIADAFCQHSAGTHIALADIEALVAETK